MHYDLEQRVPLGTVATKIVQCSFQIFGLVIHNQRFNICLSIS